MINYFRILGKSILQKEGYYDITDETKKREIFLKYQSIVPKDKLDKEKSHAIVLHFDTQKNEFEFKLDKEITPENRDYFFAFPVGSPNDKKKFLSTNNITCFYRKIFTDSFTYLKDRRKKAKSKKWFSKNISESYDNFLMELREMFYIEEGKDYILNKALIKSDQKQVFDKIEQAHSEKKIEELYSRLLNQEFLNRESKNEDKFPSIFLVKINDKHILEHENYKTSYINLVYYDLLERFFTEGGRKNTSCHICAKSSDIIGEVPLQMKFYGTTNNLFFENLRNQNAYKSFSICRNCLTEVLTGMKYIRNELQDFLLGISCYLIPSFESEEQNFEKKYKRIFNLLKSHDSYKTEIDEIENLIKKSEKKNFSFSLLFFDSPPGSQSFDVIKLIPNIEYRELAKKLKYFDDFNKAYSLFLLKRNLSLNDIRYNLFPSKYSHASYDAKIYRKDILDLFEAFLYEYQISYADMTKRFMDIYKHKIHKENIDILAPFKMVLILSIFNKIKPLKGVKIMSGNSVTEIQNADYKKFFETHKEIYENNYHRQGLFLLGTVINQILRAQKEKSSTFLKKLNFSGIPARRVSNLVLNVQEYVQIYKEQIFEERGIWGNIMDRLQGVENSAMKPEEIVFYILTGISYASYVGMIKGIEKKGEKDDNNQK